MSWRAQFVLLAAIWGSSFLFIKVLGEHWPAPWVAFGRVALGAITLTAVTLIRRERLHIRDRRVWRHLIVVALLYNVIPFTLFAYGEQHTSSIVAGLWNATTPLWVLIAVLLVFDEERLSRGRAAGMLVGFVGVALVLGPWRSLGHGELIGNLACAGAGLSYGISWPYTRRYLAGRPESALALSYGQLLCATAILAVIAPFAGAPTTHIGLKGVGSLLALGTLGTGVAYLLNYSIIRAAGAAVGSTVTYLIPVFSTALGAIVLNEPLRWNQPVGAVVLITGIAVAQGRIRRVGAAATPPAPPPVPAAAPAGESG
jgi:drug/metabolite transporter (DMT)-like permease